MNVFLTLLYFHYYVINLQTKPLHSLLAEHNTLNHFSSEMWRGKRCFIFTEADYYHENSALPYMHGRRKGPAGEALPLWILKILVKRVVFLVSRVKKHISPL